LTAPIRPPWRPGNLIREAILILRRLGAPAAVELDEADFKALSEPKRGQG
jgi:hypothetical protein